MITVEELKFAKEELSRLNIKLDNIKKKKIEIIDNISNKIISIIENYFIEEAQLFNRDIYLNIDENNNLEFRIQEVGFIDPSKPNCSVFGASFSIYYESNEIKINAGTIGVYGRKENPYNVKRELVIANIWKNIDNIEESIKSIPIEDYKNILNDYYTTKDAIKTCENIIDKVILEKLVNQIKVGDRYIYTHTSLDLKDKWLSRSDCSVIIKSITEKNITYTQKTKISEDTYRVSKDIFIKYIEKRWITKVN